MTAYHAIQDLRITLVEFTHEAFKEEAGKFLLPSPTLEDVLAKAKELEVFALDGHVEIKLEALRIAKDILLSTDTREGIYVITNLISTADPIYQYLIGESN
jgi:hypothetical protein